MGKLRLTELKSLDWSPTTTGGGAKTHTKAAFSRVSAQNHSASGTLLVDQGKSWGSTDQRPFLRNDLARPNGVAIVGKGEI